MIIDCIADLHGHYPELEGGDLLIVAGDLTARDTSDELIDFYYWITDQKYEKKIFIVGNHDNLLMNRKPFFLNPDKKTEYLCDSGTEFEYTETVCNLFDKNDKSLIYRKKLKIWGSPWTKTFKEMNPHCKAFTVDTEEELAEKWALIPNDIDILITHSPPYLIGDKVDRFPHDPEHVGSKSLGLFIKNTKIKLHVFGHIHEGYCYEELQRISDNHQFKMCNASHVNERYEPVNKPIRIIL